MMSDDISEGSAIAIIVDEADMKILETTKEVGTCFDGLYTWKKGEQPKQVADFFEWASAFENDRIVLQTTIGSYLVSTVFLGLDHNFTGVCNAMPILFETMVFGDGSGIEVDAMRYQTEDRAREGHQHAVDVLITRERARLRLESKKIRRIR